jgi:hypothetical protein
LAAVTSHLNPTDLVVYVEKNVKLYFNKLNIISETVPAKPADEMMAQQTPLLKELALWQHVASLWCCHLGMPLGGQSMIGPVSSLQCKVNNYTPNAA